LEVAVRGDGRLGFGLPLAFRCHPDRGVARWATPTRDLSSIGAVPRLYIQERSLGGRKLAFVGMTTKNKRQKSKACPANAGRYRWRGNNRDERMFADAVRYENLRRQGKVLASVAAGFSRAALK